VRPVAKRGNYREYQVWERQGGAERWRTLSYIDSLFDYANSNPRVFLDLIEVFTSGEN
jgi:hypothetical protein